MFTQITNIQEHKHLTAKNKATLLVMINSNMFKGGTKLIQYEITHLQANKYSVKKFEKFALASRNFDYRPESQIVKWHFVSELTFEVK